MGVAPWKDYLNFNSHKVNNVASYVGMPSGYAWETDADIPYRDPDNHKYPLSEQVQALSDKLGIDTEPATFDTLYPRFQTVENNVNGTGSPATGGLMQRMDAAENDIHSIEEEIGSGGGSGSGSLTTRINTLENYVGSLPSGTDPGTGLLGDVSTLKDEVEDSTDGLLPRMQAAENNITALQTTVGDSSLGLKHDVEQLQLEVEDSDTGLIRQVNDIKQTISSVYKYSGNITGVDNQTTTTAIYINGAATATPLMSLENGDVFNIEPTSPETSIIINGKAYTAGTNVALIKPDSGTPYFDELGTTIDVSRITDLENKVNTLESYFETVEVPSGGSWDSSTLHSGIYQFSSFMQSGSSETVVFIATLDDNGTVQGNPIDISNNFSTYFEVPVLSGYLTLKSSALIRSRKINIHKIGEF